MAKDSLTVNIRIDGLREVLAALKQLPKDASAELKVKAKEIATELAKSARASGIAEGSQAALVATTVKAMKDRVPVIQAGGTKKLGRNKKPAYKLLFGSEFGSDRLEQYKPHIGQDSYWFFKTVEDEQATVSRKWLEAADEVIRKFSD